MKEMYERAKQKYGALGCKPAERLIVVSIARQLLGLFTGGHLTKAYVISTSLRPPSNVKDSLGTPRGLHEIAEKHGAGTPPGIVFKNRVNTGKHFSEFTPEEQDRNLITTRIMWLRGLEPGVNAGGNVDTYERYVYIHGTNQEHLIGQPLSHGCVLMFNQDIIELFDAVRVHDPVLIDD